MRLAELLKRLGDWVPQNALLRKTFSRSVFMADGRRPVVQRGALTAV